MWRLILSIVLMCLVAPAVARAQADDWQVGATPTFSTGDYGTDTRTEIVYTPVIARRLFADGDVTLVVPHICISGDTSIATGRRHTGHGQRRLRRGRRNRRGNLPAARPRPARHAAAIPRRQAPPGRVVSATSLSEVATTFSMNVPGFPRWRFEDT